MNSYLERDWRKDPLKELNIIQPHGPSFSVEGNRVTWQGWTFHKIVTTNKAEDSSFSDASTGAGRQALNSLLGMAMEETCNSSDDKECHI
eukprot:scaffold12956_cov71-Cyclotella_meneghiniana.AAC.3